MDFDLKRTMREQARGVILFILHKAQSFGANEGVIQDVIHRVPLDMTDAEIRQQMEYLELRKLITVGRPTDSPFWWAKLTRAGIELQEGTIPCEPGIHLYKE